MNEEMKDASTRAVLDKEMLAELVRIAIGGRKIKEVMKETQLSRSTISKLLHGKSPGVPGEDTLLKLAGGKPNDLYWKMLEVCGESNEEQYRKTMLRQQLQQDLSSERKIIAKTWTQSTALAMILDSLKQGGYAENFRIDYQSEGVFAIDIGAMFPILVFITITSLEKMKEELLDLVSQRLGFAYSRWEMSESAYFLLTIDEPVFEALKHYPNQTTKLAVALAGADGRRFEAQEEIRPLLEAFRSDQPFPVDLTRA